MKANASLRGLLARFLVVFGALMLTPQIAVGANSATPPTIAPVPAGEVNPLGDLNDLVIVIDPGHGTKSGSRTGSNRTYDGTIYYEDDMVWNMALGAREYFQSVYSNTQVIFTHDTIADDDDWQADGDVDYTDRWWMANNLKATSVTTKLGYTPRKSKADLFLSFHMNISADTTIRGTICYRSDLGTATTWANMSSEFCTDVVNSTDDVFPVRNSTPQSFGTDKYFDSLNMPQAVVEAGFLSNRTDALWFASSTNAKLYGQYAAWAAMDFWFHDCGTTCQP